MLTPGIHGIRLDATSATDVSIGIISSSILSYWAKQAIIRVTAFVMGSYLAEIVIAMR